MSENNEHLRRELDTAYRQLEQTASRLILVNQAGELTTRTHDTREIGQELLASILDSVFSASGMVILYSRGGAVFDILTAQGVDEEVTEAFKGSESEATALWISSLRKSAVTREQIQSSPEWEERLAAPHFAVYLPLHIEEELVGALVVGDKTAGEGFDASELSFLNNLGHHAAIALNHAQLYGQLKKRLRDLDTLLKISHEITSTLDLDRILKTVVTMASALSDSRHCAIGIYRGGKLGLDATGGEKVDREGRDRFERLLDYVALAETEVSVTVSDLPEGEGGNLFKTYFEETGTKSLWGMPMKDDQGVLGAYCQVGEGGVPGDEEIELLRIMGNQATVAIRNAELYNQVPFIGFIEPILEKRRRIWAAGRKRFRSIAIGTVAVLALLLLVRLPYRTGGRAAVFPGSRLELRSPISGVVAQIWAAEGDVVGPDRPVGRVQNMDLELKVRDLQSAVEKARRDEATARVAGDMLAARLAQVDRESYTQQLGLVSAQLAAASMAPPFRAIVLTPHVDERLGDYLSSGDVFCEVGRLDSLRVEVALPEKDWHSVQIGQPVKMKFYAYAEKTFDGHVDILAPAALNTQDGERVLIATAHIAAPEGLRPGMTGVAKVRMGSRSLLWVITRPFRRFIGLRWWG